MQEQTWQPPEWWYQGKCPTNDEAYFENMSRIIFQAGLNWRVIDQKWPTIKKAFLNFNIEKIASFTDVTVQELMKDAGIIRNKGKINAIIYNAKGFKVIKKQSGSFQKSTTNVLEQSNANWRHFKLSGHRLCRRTL